MIWSSLDLARWMDCASTSCPLGSKDLRLSAPNLVLLPAASTSPTIITQQMLERVGFVDDDAARLSGDMLGSEVSL